MSSPARKPNGRTTQNKMVSEELTDAALALLDIKERVESDFGDVRTKIAKEIRGGATLRPDLEFDFASNTLKRAG